MSASSGFKGGERFAHYANADKRDAKMPGPADRLYSNHPPSPPSQDHSFNKKTTIHYDI